MQRRIDCRGGDYVFEMPCGAGGVRICRGRDEVFMKKGIFGVLSAAVITASFSLVACGDAVVVKEAPATVDEGVDTKCEITGYTDFTNIYSSYFLKEGDKVAVISPSALPTKEQTEAVVEGLKKWGYIPVEGKYTCVEERTLENCLEDLNRALEDPEIKAIYCVRGGHASCEVMDLMPIDVIASAKKPIIGYSDISVYHSAWTLAGLPSIHSSMSATFTELPEECAEAQQHLLKGEVPGYRCESSAYDRQGSAEGVLIGGNLSTVLTVLDTDYDVTKTDEPFILFLEDVNVNTEYVHRCMTVLKHKGVLERAAGIVFGEWTEVATECDTYNGNSRGGRFKSVADMLDRQFVNELDIPVAYGFPAGHGENNYPLLMGAKVQMDVRDGEYTMEWIE